jgi:SAM-dependent methyltransferase
MESIEYQRMFDLEDHHWWFQGRINLMRRMVERHCPRVPGRKPRLLDLGCGTGLFIREQNQDKSAFGLDFSREALELSRTGAYPDWSARIHSRCPLLRRVSIL